MHGIAPARIVAAAITWLVLLTWPVHALASGDLVLEPQLPLLIPLVVLFGLLVFPLNALIFKPIFHALDERASRIVGARQRADHIASEADRILAQYEASIREARDDAETSRKEMLMSARAEQAGIAAEARSDAEALVEKARTDLARALEEARSGLRASSESLGRAAAARILGRNLQ